MLRIAKLLSKFFFVLRDETLINTDSYEDQLNIVMAIDGQISRNEASVLISLAKSIAPDDVIVEIGSYRGRSSVALSLGAIMNNNNRVLAIDPHYNFVGILGGQFGPDDQDEFYKNIANSGVGKVVSLISLPAVDAAKAWSKKNVGLLWIDGDHRYSSVRADYEAWVPYLVDRGIIAFHDSNIPDVQRCIRELLDLQCISPIGVVDSLSWFQKNEQL